MTPVDPTTINRLPPGWDPGVHVATPTTPATPTVPAAPDAGGGTAPTFDPSVWNTDPGIQDAQNQASSIQKQIDDWLRESASQAVIKFGDPALAGMAGFGMDPQAGTFAQQNYLSGNADLARLDKSRDLARKAVIDRLASHGILNSGDLGYGEQQANSTYGNQVYDARSALLTYLRSLQSQALGQKSNASQLVANAKNTAYNNSIQKFQADLASWIAAHQAAG